MSETMRPCPFCGKYDLSVDIDSFKIHPVGGGYPVRVPVSTTVTCHVCGYTMEIKGDYEKIWNRRASE